MCCYYCHKPLAITHSESRYGLHLTCFQQWLQLQSFESRFYDLYQRHEPQQERTSSYNNTSFFQGVFEKYSAHLEGKSYILKLSKEYEELPFVEFLCNKIANILGLSVPAYFLCDLEAKRPCFITYNFMQDYKNSDLKHIYHYIPPEKTFNIETLCSVIGKETGRFPEILKFLRMCLFDAFIGNHDRHGRNIALIVSPGKTILAPLYDNPSFFGIAEFLEAENQPRGRIQTQKEENPTLIDYTEEFERLGYKQETKTFLQKIAAHKDQVLTTVLTSFLSEKRKNAFMRFLTQKFEEIDHVLQRKI